ncbi:MAG: 3-deoxy-manno-octulosonate cytidylyltransferase, partial [Ignavibacteria bacterium]|nr:3-deoxy-manno-octulosonate cytidylyltransferase [Ignavibacteria bacterium]
DDEKVEQVCRGFGAEVMMTPKSLATGTDRIAYVINNIEDADIVVNIQGDEPFISGSMIDQTIEPHLFDKQVKVSTLVKRVESVVELHSPDVVKVVFDYSNNALYFSRSQIPYVRDSISDENAIENTEIYKHLGLYVYRREALLKFTKLKSTDLENAEKLEQLRMLENGFIIKIVVTELEIISVDTPEDLKRARAYYNWLQTRKK